MNAVQHDIVAVADFSRASRHCGSPYFLPKIIAHGQGGHIANTSSMAGLIPLPSGGGLYATSKFPVRGLTDSLRLALGVHNIGVSVLCPGMTRTRIMEAEKHRPLHGASPATEPKSDEWMSTFDMGGGMDPIELGERVLLGIQRNDTYILPHGEFKEEVQGLFDEIISGFPEGQQIDRVRLMFEDVRRRTTADAKAAIKNG